MSQNLAIMPLTPRRQHHVGTLTLLWHTKDGSDITIRSSDGVELKAHRLVLERSSWMANTMAMQRPSAVGFTSIPSPLSSSMMLTKHKDTVTSYLQLEEQSTLVRPLIAFCYGIELPPLKKGLRTETQLRTLLDLYHLNHYKYHIPKLGAVCEAELANPNLIDSPCKIGQKSSLHAAISRILGQKREGLSDTGDKQRLVPFEEGPQRHDSVISDASIPSDVKGKCAANAHDDSTTVEPRREGIAIPGAPQMARLRSRSPGGSPLSSPRLYVEIMEMLGSDNEPSPMLSPAFLSARPAVQRLSFSFHPDSPESATPSGLSMSPWLEDNFSLSEDTLHLVPRPLHTTKKRRTNGSAATGSRLFGPRPLPSAQASQSTVNTQEMPSRTLAHQPSRASIKDGMFSSLKDATRRAFSGKSKQ
ncbi:hypothetical protein IWX91DRAFT_322069 [Phyllosticta citricarpa]